MKRQLLACCLFVWLLAIEPACANPCSYPKRIMNGYAVDLQPLLDWWANPKGLRPLAGWKHVRGSIERDTALGWVINGKAEGQPHISSFLMKSPPREKLRRFEELKRQQAQLEQARTATLEVVALPVQTAWWYWPWSQRGHGQQPISAAEHHEASVRLEEVDRQLSSLRNQLGPQQDEHGNFRVDAFAIRLSEAYQGLPVFEHGVPQLH